MTKAELCVPSAMPTTTVNPVGAGGRPDAFEAAGDGPLGERHEVGAVLPRFADRGLDGIEAGHLRRRDRERRRGRLERPERRGGVGSWASQRRLSRG